ncbi:MAG: flagellin [Myxococcota bacterium]
MAMSIVTNVQSLNAQRNLNKTSYALSSNFQKLSSGLRINRAGDDAAGLAISEEMKADIRSFRQAERNANDAVSMLQTGEGALNEVSGILIRMRELTVQSATDTVTDTQRGYLDQEFQALEAEIDRIASVTEFNGVNLLGGSATGLQFQVGVNNTSGDRITFSFGDVRSTALGSSGSGGTISAQAITSQSGAQSTISVLDAAIGDISSLRSDIGATENRLQITVANLSSARENISAANSRIRDVDVAEETAALTRNNILQQAGVSMLAQANQSPQLALSLLG